MRKICVITGTRADYGLLTGVMKKINLSDTLNLQVIASCMHLSSKFGLTYKEIENDGFIIDKKIDMQLEDDSALKITNSLAIGVKSFANAFNELKPDLVIILGDRFEALAAAQSAMMAKIPIAHIHGGEVTEGAIDESIRHAITKMSNIHFVSTDEYRNRVIQLGELPERVILSGAPGIDNISQVQNITKDECEDLLDFKLGNVNFLVTYHSETMNKNQEDAIQNLLKALSRFKDAHIIITYPNADEGASKIIDYFKKYFKNNQSNTLLVKSLGYKKYLQTLRHMNCVIGNSSSGIIEVPSFEIPTINIGDRQKGRIRGKSIIDCDDSYDEIVSAIELGLSKEFVSKIKNYKNPYGNGNAADIICKSISAIDLKSIIKKPFHDIGV
tara:strand:+ start:1050 stop:2207 length:1158 start_codon:yes stop_codon:yes gene_type:complete